MIIWGGLANADPMSSLASGSARLVLYQHRQATVTRQVPGSATPPAYGPWFVFQALL